MLDQRKFPNLRLLTYIEKLSWRQFTAICIPSGNELDCPLPLVPWKHSKYAQCGVGKCYLSYFSFLAFSSGEITLIYMFICMSPSEKIFLKPLPIVFLYGYWFGRALYMWKIVTSCFQLFSPVCHFPFISINDVSQQQSEFFVQLT